MRWNSLAKYMDETNIEELLVVVNQAKPAETPEDFSGDLFMLSTASYSSKLMLEPVLNSSLEF